MQQLAHVGDEQQLVQSVRDAAKELETLLEMDAQISDAEKATGRG